MIGEAAPDGLPAVLPFVAAPLGSEKHKHWTGGELMATRGQAKHHIKQWLEGKDGWVMTSLVRAGNIKAETH